MMWTVNIWFRTEAKGWAAANTVMKLRVPLKAGDFD
jgi:hypothetical protein